MSQTICLCAGSNTKNTGLPSCVKIPKEIKMNYFVPTFDSTGALNFIPAGQAIDDTYVDSMINNEDPSKRWYPSPKYQQVDVEVADNNFQENRDQSQFFLGQGSSTITAQVTLYPASYKSVFDSYRCGDWSAFSIDRVNVFWGYATDLTGLYPRRISKQSSATKFMREVHNTSVSFLEFKYLWDITTDDACIATDVDATANFLSKVGLLDGLAYQTSGVRGINVLAATSYSFAAKDAYGNEILGLVTADFALTNETTDAAVVLTSVEGANGVYTHTVLAQTTNDIGKLSGTAAAIVKGFDLVQMGTPTFLFA